MLTANAIQILEARYLLRDAEGHSIESPEQMFSRVARHVARAEEDSAYWEGAFYRIMDRLEFLPNSPTLMNSGLPDGQLSACFVLPIEDRLSAIFETLKNAALIHQSGGGTGFNFSQLRPKDDPVTSSGGFSSGPLAFLNVFDAATEYVKQGGRRRGANMGILNIDHPDIEAFISAKSDSRSLHNFNLSVGISDRFMHALEDKNDWALINPRTKKAVNTVKALTLWRSIVEQAWSTGDPGLIFLDTLQRHNPVPGQTISSTNPCGEVPLADFESCNLGSLNLSKMLITDQGRSRIDWEKLEHTISRAIRFLDNVITVNHYVLPGIEEITHKNRKIGLGIMGWAEMLILLDIPYASDEAVELAERLMKFVREASYRASADLARERGNFPAWKQSLFYPDRPMRNATCNSIAPTGTISVIANTSYSIEPLYALAYQRSGILDDQTQFECNGLFIEKMKQEGYWNRDVWNRVQKTGRIQDIELIPEPLKELFQTSLDIPWTYHLAHQKAFQKFTDNAVSKTINLPEDTSMATVSEIYRKAWEDGLKGITVFRDKSRPEQVLHVCAQNGPGNPGEDMGSC